MLVCAAIKTAKSRVILEWMPSFALFGERSIIGSHGLLGDMEPH